MSDGRFGAGRVVAADDIPAAIEAFIRISERTPWAAAGLPVTAFAHRQGTLAHVHHGPLEVDDLMAVIREHLS